jgi:predicted porin
VTFNFGVNSPNESFSNAGRAVPLTVALANRTAGVAPVGSIGTCYGIEARGTKIGYFTPSFGGFTFAISYAPSGSTRNPGGGYFYGSDLKSKQAMNVLSVGADFDHDFGRGITLIVGGGGEWALDSYTSYGASNADKPSTYALGAQLGIGGFAVGASGAYVNNYKQAGYAATDAFSTDDGWIATVGGSYTIQAWSIGLQGMYSRWQVYGDQDHDNIWGVSLNGSYALGPGITLEGQVAYTKYQANQVFGGPGAVFPNGIFSPGYTNPMNYDAVELDAGFAINF